MTVNLSKILNLYGRQSSEFDQETLNQLQLAIDNASQLIDDCFPDFLNLVCLRTNGLTQFVESLDFDNEDQIKDRIPHLVDRYQLSNFIRNERTLANYTYAHMYGNGTHMSDDGYKYRKRGALVNICGRINYKKCSQALFGDDRLLTNPELLSDNISIAFDSAVWFWNKYCCHKYTGDLVVMLKALNRSNRQPIEDITEISIKAAELRSLLSQ